MLLWKQCYTLLWITVHNSGTEKSFRSKNQDSARISCTWKRISKYKERNLSLSGKIIVINSCILPLTYYSAQTFIYDDNTIKKIENSIRNLLWNRGINQISLSKMYIDKRKGGLSLINPYEICLVLYTKSIFSSKNNFQLNIWSVIKLNLILIFLIKSDYVVISFIFYVVYTFL